MNESLDTVFNTGESAKGCDPGNDARDNLSRCIAHPCPGVHTGMLERQGDFLFVFIDAEDLDFHLLADFEHLARMIDTAPGQLTEMHQSLCTSQVDKSAKVGEIADHAAPHLTRLQFLE